MLLRILIVFAIAPALSHSQVTLQSSPQKFRTFFALNDARVPRPLRETANLKATASDRVGWYAASRGLIRASSQPEYFAGRRYLPDDHVLSLVPDHSAGMWARTETGVSHIEFRPMTLAAKAELFESRIALRHNRHGLVSPSTFATAGDPASSRTRDDDNDGLWTSMYAAAECFRYAVTKSPQALAKARSAVEAVLFLEEVTGKCGFPARSYIEKGEPMPKDGQWHWTEDGRYYWKGDTSSDEIVGHMFVYAIATDLLPDSSLKTRIVAATARIMNHILDHGYYLIDVTGRPTTWGRWSPEYFAKAKSDSTLNALELLSFLKTAFHITHNPRYAAEYRKVAFDLGYAKLATRYLELRDEINYSDEELAMLSFYPLLRYETDEPLLRDYYGPALAAWWQNESREDNPLWIFIHALGDTPSHDEFAVAAQTLYRMPVDTICWTVKNSDRPDIKMDSTIDRFQKLQAKTLLPRDELPVAKWNSNPFVIDGGDDGRSEDDGTAFLLPYWLGRYHRFLLGQ